MNCLISKTLNKISRFNSDLHYQLSRIKHSQNLANLTPFDQTIVDTCKQEGVFITSLETLELQSSHQLLQATKTQLSRMETLILSQKIRGETRQNSSPTYPQIFTVTDLPEFYTWGNEARLLNIAENYIGLPIKFQGIHLRRDFANKNPVTTEFWHQDLEDRRMLKIIIYLMDVTEKHGPFEYIPKSKVSYLATRHILTKTWRANALGISDQEMEHIVPKSNWISCPGPAGTVIFVDTKAVFHHGQPRQLDRSALFFIYTAANPLHPECCTQYSDQTFARPKESLLLPL